MRGYRVTRLLSGLLLALFSIPTMGMEIVGGTPEDHAAFKQLQQVWIESYLSGDLDTLMTLHDEDTILMPRRQPTLDSLEAIRGFFESRVGKYDIEFNDDPKELRINGDWAFLWGQFTLVGRPKDGGEPFHDAGRYFVLYKKNANGEWRIFRDIDNVMPAPE